jgi:hypothetical protein
LIDAKDGKCGGTDVYDLVIWIVTRYLQSLTSIIIGLKMFWKTKQKHPHLRLPRRLSSQVLDDPEEEIMEETFQTRDELIRKISSHVHSEPIASSDYTITQNEDRWLESQP